MLILIHVTDSHHRRHENHLTIASMPGAGDVAALLALASFEGQVEATTNTTDNDASTTNDTNNTDTNTTNKNPNINDNISNNTNSDPGGSHRPRPEQGAGPPRRHGEVVRPRRLPGAHAPAPGRREGLHQAQEAYS